MPSGLVQRSRQAAPFAGAASLPFLLLALPGLPIRWGLVACGAGLTLALIIAGVAVPWRRGARVAALLGGLGYLATVALLREACGGNPSGLGPLVLVPVIWFALYRGRLELSLSITGAALVYWVPVALNPDDPRYPASGWRIGLVFIAVSAILAYTIQHLQRQLRRQAAQLDDLAHTDPLTGLPNLRAWNTGLRRGLRIAERTGRPLCLAVLDVDNFKEINDRHGHAGGDHLLKGAAAAWADVLRQDDLMARVGGDEFAVLLSDCDLSDAAVLIERLQATAPQRMSCSIGAAQWDGYENASSLLRRADAALYAAKHAGRDRLVLSGTGRDGARISTADPGTTS